MWAAVLVISVLAIYVLYETVGPTMIEGFFIPRRSDIGPSDESKEVKEESGYDRDLRYTSQYADVQGNGVAGDFCRVVSKSNDPDSLRVACALALREGMDTLEFRSKSKREGFRFSRDDYWRDVTGNKRMDYCRILRDQDQETGGWDSFCALTTRSGIGPKEVHDPSPPAAIRRLLTAYEGILAWYRWQDDGIDTTGNTQVALVGRPEIPSLLRPMKTRGLQLNRYPAATAATGEAAPPIRDMVRFGEKGTLHLDQDVKPDTIRAIAFWIFWDQFEKGAAVLHCSTEDDKNRVWLGVDGSGPGPAPMKDVQIGAAQELTPQDLQRLGSPRVEEVPLWATQRPQKPDPHSVTGDLERQKTATWIFEIWDERQRIMRLRGPQGAKIGQWQHVVVTTTDNTPGFPTWQLWLDGVMTTEQPDGRLIPALFLTNNRIGENVRGCIQDFRIYRDPMSAEKIKEAMDWSGRLLHPTP
jgi:hypothetical protein